MIVQLNDKSYVVTAGMTLELFIKSLDVQPQGIAVAVDYEVVPKSKWNETKLEDGMALMMIHAVSGG